MAVLLVIDKDKMHELPMKIMQFRRALVSLKHDPDQIMYPGGDAESMMEELLKHYDQFFKIVQVDKPPATMKEEMEKMGVVFKDLTHTEVTPV